MRLLRPFSVEKGCHPPLEAGELSELLLLARVPQHSAALALLTEAILGRQELEEDLVEALLEKGGEEVEARLAGGE